MASASDWLAALPEGTPASSRIEEPSAVMKDSRCSRRTVCTAGMVERGPAGPGGAAALERWTYAARTRRTRARITGSVSVSFAALGGDRMGVLLVHQ